MSKDLVPDPSESVAFLEQLRPNGPWLLTAIVPDGGPTTTATLTTAEEVHAFVTQQNCDGKSNVYFSTNPTRQAMSKKAAKTDIARIEYVQCDLDPRPDETP